MKSIAKRKKKKNMRACETVTQAADDGAPAVQSTGAGAAKRPTVAAVAKLGIGASDGIVVTRRGKGPIMKQPSIAYALGGKVGGNHRIPGTSGWVIACR